MRIPALFPAFVALGLVFDTSGSVEFHAAAASEIPAVASLAIPNRIGAWPAAKTADRLFIVLENLDEGGDVLLVSVRGIGVKRLKGEPTVFEHRIDLPHRGLRSVIIPLSRILDKLDRRKIDELVFSVEGGAHRRFLVRRMAFLSPGESAPIIQEAPRRNIGDEADHARDLARFRRECVRDGLAVGQVSSMEAVRPRAGFAARPADEVVLRLARNEYESVQLVVATTDGDLRDVRVEFSALRNGSALFAADNLKCSPVGFVETKDPPPYEVRPAVKCPSRGWWPDAILDFTDRADVLGDDVQPFWIRVKCPEGQKSGVYIGQMTVRARSQKGAVVRKIPLRIRVNGFTLPRTSMLPLAVSFWPGPSGVGATDGREDVVSRRRENPQGLHNAWKTREQAYGGFLADYLLTWDSLYLNPKREPRYDVLKRLKAENRLGMFNLSYWWYFSGRPGSEEHWRTNALPRLRARYDRAKALGIADRAYLYGCDEVGPAAFEDIARTVRRLHRELPGVKLMTTARDKRLGVDGSPLAEMDIFCPATCFWNPEQVKKSRAAGHEVWWYFCNVPSYPFANALLETPPIELRSLMGAQTVKYRPDGFLYYSTASWNADRPLMNPFGDWDARTFSIYHGDGQWTCCGGKDMMPMPTLRLENFRDGLEDYAYAKLLERRRAERRDRSDLWAKSADEALAVPKSLVESLKKFSIDPSEVYAWRNRMADLLEAD